jgi:tetratricopeptide (TPR) repeat protein
MRAAMRLHQAGRLADAERIYERVLATEPERRDALHMLGVVALQSGRAERARDLITRAVTGAPDDARMLSNLGEAHRQTGDPAAAIECYDRALAVDPRLAGTHANKGKALAALGQDGEAVAAYRLALGIEPDTTGVLTDLGNALIALDRVDDGVAAYRRVLEIEPDHGNALTNLGGVLKNLGRVDDAIALLERAVEAESGLAMAHFNHGLALKEARQPDAALAAFRRAVAIDPDLAEAHYAHALLHGFRPNDETLATLKEAVADPALSDNTRAYFLFALGKGHDDLGHHDEAFSFIRQGNQAMAGDVAFDGAGFRARIDWIKGRFAERHDPPPGRDGGPVPVFILGPSRSGKTLIEGLLADRPDVHAAGEGSQWADALRKIADRHGMPNSLLVLMDSLDEAGVAEVGTAFLDSMAAESPDAGWFINTAPGYFETVGLILRALPSARIIHCRRDPIDTGLQIYFSRYRSANDHAYDLDHIATYISGYRAMMAHWTRLHDDRILDVAYEDLVRDTARQAARISAFTGLPPSTAVAGGLTETEVGHWKHYSAHLAPLIEAFGPVED